MATLLATLSACAASQAPLKPAADPIVTTRTVTRTVCPAEVTATSPDPVPAYVGAAIVVPPLYLAWVAAHLRRERLLDARAADARSQCP